MDITVAVNNLFKRTYFMYHNKSDKLYQIRDLLTNEYFHHHVMLKSVVQYS